MQINLIFIDKMKIHTYITLITSLCDFTWAQRQTLQNSWDEIRREANVSWTVLKVETSEQHGGDL